MRTIFHDRRDAGMLLAQRLAKYANKPQVVVLALPRGGVPVGSAVAQALGLPLDVLIVRKLGVPGNEELGFGAIASGGLQVLNSDIVESFGLTDEMIAAVAEREQRELSRRELAYRGKRPPIPAKGNTVILVDDGIATGATVRAALLTLRHEGAARIVIAAPIVAPEVFRDLEDEADQVVALLIPDHFYSVGQGYENFSQTTDEEVTTLLAKAQSADRPEH